MFWISFWIFGKKKAPTKKPYDKKRVEYNLREHRKGNHPTVWETYKPISYYVSKAKRNSKKVGISRIKKWI